MTVAIHADADQRPRRRLTSVEQLADRYMTPKSSMYDFLKSKGAEAGVLRIGRRILVDVDVFDEYVSRGK